MRLKRPRACRCVTESGKLGQLRRATGRRRRRGAHLDAARRRIGQEAAGAPRAGGGHQQLHAAFAEVAQAAQRRWACGVLALGGSGGKAGGRGYQGALQHPLRRTAGRGATAVQDGEKEVGKRTIAEARGGWLGALCSPLALLGTVAGCQGPPRRPHTSPQHRFAPRLLAGQPAWDTEPDNRKEQQDVRNADNSFCLQANQSADSYTWRARSICKTSKQSMVTVAKDVQLLVQKD